MGRAPFEEKIVVDSELEFKIEQMELMVKRWKRQNGLYRRIMREGEASPKEEKEYGDLATYFARTCQPLCMRCGLKLPPDADLLRMVTDVSDAQSARDMGDMQRRKFENDWRTNNTAMQQKLGELQLLSKELEDVSAFVYHMKRFFSVPVVQWTTGASIVVILLGLFGVFGYLYKLAGSFIESVK